MLNAEIKILVIDDMAAMRMRIMNQLKTMGFLKIEQAENGQHGYELIKKEQAAEQPFQLIISDWNMPLMTGIELLEKVRADSTLTGLPFIMVTAEGEKPLIIRAVKSGVTDYLIKPVDKAALEKKLLNLPVLRKVV